MTPEQRERRACTPAAVAASRPEDLDDDERWDPFFPEPRPGVSNRQAWEAGRKICAQCPPDVRSACFEIGRNEPHGMFGGMTARERGSHHRRGGPLELTASDRVEAAALRMTGEFTVGDVMRAAGVDTDTSVTLSKAKMRRLAEIGVFVRRIDDRGRGIYRKAAA